MGGGDAVGLIWGVGALVLVGSALFARRLPLGQAAKMALAWVAIFAIGFVIFTFRDDMANAGRRVMAELGPGQASEGETLRVRKSADGHFWVTARVNGNEERFLIDSGASISALSVGAARRSGVERDGGFAMVLQTANGPVSADRAHIAEFALGPIRREDLGVAVAEEFGGINVLGMNFLSSLSGWSVEGDWLVLRA